MGFLPPYMKEQGINTLWDVVLLLVLAVFFMGGILIATGFFYFVVDGMIENWIGLSSKNIIKSIYKRKFLVYLKKRSLKAGDIIAFRFDGVLVPLKVTDNWLHTKSVVAKPLKVRFNDEIQLHYIAILAEAKNSFNYDEIEILDQKMMMKILYGK